MGLHDAEMYVSTLQAVTDTSKLSEDYIDADAAGSAVGRPLYFVVRVGAAFTGGTSLNFSLVTDDETSFTNPIILAESGVIAEADLTINKIVWACLVPPACKRYLAGYSTTDGTHSTGSVDMYFTYDLPVAEAGY